MNFKSWYWCWLWPWSINVSNGNGACVSTNVGVVGEVKVGVKGVCVGWKKNQNGTYCLVLVTISCS